MEVLVPGVMALMIDKGMSGGSIGYILKIGAVLLVMSMMALVFGILAGDKCGQGLGRYGTEFEKGYVPPHTGVFFFQY